MEKERKRRRQETGTGETKEQAQAAAPGRLPETGTGEETRERGAGRRKQAVGQAELRRGQELLQRYKQGKGNLERRIVENEEWYKRRHWEGNEEEPRSGWLLNCLMNKHADAMDNYPEATVLPREESDQEAARMLTSVLPCVLEQNGYEQVYSDMWWYKLKSGTGVQGVFWNPRKENGLGDVEIRKIDLLNLFWEPGVSDIQESPNVFHVELTDRERLKAMYPQLEEKEPGEAVTVTRYIYDESIDVSEKTAVVDWYYKKEQEGRTALHYVKFAGDTVLFATENEEAFREEGLYAHGQYPFVLDALFPVEGSPAGFGYVDIMKDAQMYIDKTDGIILRNGAMAAKKRWMIREDGGINEEEYADWNKDFVHVAGQLDDSHIREVSVSPIDGAILSIKQGKIEELKEISGNRDVNQGGNSGATAASAIAAMQEAGSKLSRDMIKSSYRAFKRVCELVIELMRQFYQEPRFFRILGGQGEERFVSLDNTMMGGGNMGSAFGMELGERRPVYDLKIKTHKASAYAREAQNQMAMQFYSAGFFAPQMADQALACLEMMDFEGKDGMARKIQANGTMYQQIQQLTAMVQKLAMIVDGQNGTNTLGEAAGMLGTEAGAESAGKAGDGRQPETNSLGQTKNENAIVNRARERAASATSPRG